MQYAEGRRSAGVASAVARVFGAGLLALALASGAEAQVVTNYTGTTVGGPTWQNPQTNPGQAPYETKTFSVTAQGNYALHVTWTFDGYLYLYGNSFDPNNWMTNFLASNDDFNGIYESKIDLLTPGTYVLVHTAYGTTSGTYAGDITGPAAVTFGAASTSPAVTAVNPATGPTTGQTAVTITGTNFTGATQVTFGGAAATALNVQSATTITCTTPAGTAGTASVVVTSPAGTSAANTLFTYTAPAGPAPTIASVTPATGPEAGGTSVSIAGTNLTGATAVLFGGANATSVVVVSATQVRCVTPPNVGAVSVTVITPNGSSAQSVQFAYYNAVPPTVTGVSPANGPAQGGTAVTVFGRDFRGARAVSFGGVYARDVFVMSDTQITCTTPRNMGNAPVVVYTMAGRSVDGTIFVYEGQIAGRGTSGNGGGCAYDARGGNGGVLVLLAIGIALALLRRRA